MKWNDRVSLAMFLAMGLFVLSSGGCGSESSDPVAANISAGGAGTDNSSSSPAVPAATLSSGEAGQSATPGAKAVVVFKTSQGTFKVQLDPAAAPGTVDNFLRNYVDTKHYTDTVFHYIEKGALILGGGFTHDLEEKRTRAPIANEASKQRTNVRGTISMARDPDYAHSATCQFFINVVDNPGFDYQEGQEPGYCVFGEVIEGLDVVDKISNVQLGNNADFPNSPADPVVIQSVERTR